MSYPVIQQPLGAVLVLLALFWSGIGVHGEERWWEGEWSAPEMPNVSSPSWTYYQGGEITQTEFLNIRSSVEESTASYTITSDSGFWKPGPQGVTVEFELRVNAMEGGHACALTVSGLGPEKNKAYAVFFGPAWVQFQNGSRIPFDEAEFHKFRLTSTGEEAVLYLDGQSTPIVTTTDSVADTKSALSFGDLSGFGGGDVDWKQIRWTDKGAVTP